MKLSVSLSDDDVATLDAFVRVHGLPSRSAALQRAVAMLRLPGLEDDYATAWQDWADSGEAEAWEHVAGDGITRAAR